MFWGYFIWKDELSLFKFLIRQNFLDVSWKLFHQNYQAEKWGNRRLDSVWKLIFDKKNSRKKVIAISSLACLCRLILTFSAPPTLVLYSDRCSELWKHIMLLGTAWSLYLLFSHFFFLRSYFPLKISYASFKIPLKCCLLMRSVFLTRL